jgi:hypothetical protein
MQARRLRSCLVPYWKPSAYSRAVNLKLANGQVEERRVGTVTAETGGEQESIICVFGDAEALH